jgi:serine/threonine-protein kinase
MSGLKGDLDNIVLKALSKEPERRYQTVEQFSADVWRFVDGLPVLARRATVSYRASKFYGRNMASVWAAALIFLSLCAGLTAALWQAQAARRQERMASEARRLAESEAERARAEKGRAERTSRFMQGFLEYANPHWYGRGDGRLNVTVREAIDDASARIDTELSDEPEVRADLHYTVGEIYRVSGVPKFALRHFRQSLDLYRQVHGERHPKVARGIYYVCTVMDDAEGAGVEEVEPPLRQAVGMMRETDPENVNLPYMLQTLASWVMHGEREGRDERRLAEAEGLLREAKTLFTRHYGENHVATVTADGSLASLARARGDLALEEGIREGLVGRFGEAEGGAYDHVRAMFNLAMVKLRLGKRAEAEKLFGQAAELGRARWGANDPRLARLLRDIGRARASTAVK